MDIALSKHPISFDFSRTFYTRLLHRGHIDCTQAVHPYYWNTKHARVLPLTCWNAMKIWIHTCEKRYTWMYALHSFKCIPVTYISIKEYILTILTLSMLLRCREQVEMWWKFQFTPRKLCTRVTTIDVRLNLVSVHPCHRYLNTKV